MRASILSYLWFLAVVNPPDSSFVGLCHVKCTIGPYGDAYRPIGGSFEIFVARQRAGKSVGEDHWSTGLTVSEGYENNVVSGLTFRRDLSIGTTMHREECSSAIHVWELLGRIENEVQNSRPTWLEECSYGCRVVAVLWRRFAVTAILWTDETKLTCAIVVRVRPAHIGRLFDAEHLIWNCIIIDSADSVWKHGVSAISALRCAIKGVTLAPIQSSHVTDAGGKMFAIAEFLVRLRSIEALDSALAGKVRTGLQTHRFLACGSLRVRTYITAAIE
jgi:hypothetical protein